MIRQTAIATIALLSLVAPAQPSVIVQISNGINVPNLPGYKSYTLTAVSTFSGEQVYGFDFASQPTFGFFGAMNQVGPPTINTTFQDNNALIPLLNPGKSSAEDSQFLISTQQANIAVPSGFASESSAHLRAVFASGSPLGMSVPFAQIVLPEGTGLSFKGKITTQAVLGDPVDHDVLFYSCLSGPCGSAAQMVDETINNVNPNVPGSLPHTISASQIAALSNFQFDSYIPAPGYSGTGPANAATLNLSTRVFSWNTVGSAPGTYKWTMTAGNTVGFDNGSLTINVVPEPTTAALLGLVFVGSLSIIRRR